MILYDQLVIGDATAQLEQARSVVNSVALHFEDGQGLLPISEVGRCLDGACTIIANAIETIESAQDKGADAGKASTPHVSGQETGRAVYSGADERAQTDEVHRRYAEYLATKERWDALPSTIPAERDAEFEAAYQKAKDAFLATELTSVDHILFAIEVMSTGGENDIQKADAKRLHRLAVALRTERIANLPPQSALATYMSQRKEDGLSPEMVQLKAIASEARGSVYAASVSLAGVAALLEGAQPASEASGKDIAYADGLVEEVRAFVSDAEKRLSDIEMFDGAAA